MSSSIVGIYNQALGLLGGNELSSVQAPEEESNEARLCNLFYPGVKRLALESHVWSFALKTETLSLLGEGGADYALRYALPADCLLPVKLAGFGAEESPPFRIVGRELHASVGQASLEYIRDVEDAAVFPQYFTEALVYGLAAQLAIAHRNDQRLQQNLYAGMQLRLGEAKARDAARNNFIRPRGSWLRSRG
jgi:hypothetical protein